MLQPVLHPHINTMENLRWELLFITKCTFQSAKSLAQGFTINAMQFISGLTLGGTFLAIPETSYHVLFFNALNNHYNGSRLYISSFEMNGPEWQNMELVAIYILFTDAEC